MREREKTKHIVVCDRLEDNNLPADACLVVVESIDGTWTKGTQVKCLNKKCRLYCTGSALVFDAGTRSNIYTATIRSSIG